MENLIDRRCAGCVQNCDNRMYYTCAAPQPKYSSLTINVANKRCYEIDEKLKEYFAENPTDTIHSINRIKTYNGEGLLIIFQKN